MNSTSSIIIKKIVFYQYHLTEYYTNTINWWTDRKPHQNNKKKHTNCCFLLVSTMLLSFGMTINNKLIHISSLTAAHFQSSLRVASVPRTILYTPVFINSLAVSGTESLGMVTINSSKCSLTTAHAQ